jgi:3-hydroxybutyryl-CoA dehydrogenase
MGRGIAQLLAQKNVKVVLIDLNKEILEKAITYIQEQVMLFNEHGMLDRDVNDVVENITFSTDLQDVNNSWLVIEAIPEKLELKQELFKKLEEICDPTIRFATNTSGLSIDDIAKTMRNPERLIGTHFFMPATIVPLVEVVKGDLTSTDVINDIMEFLKKVGKYPALINKSIPGFIGNRIQHAIAREAISILEKGIASAEDIDLIVRWSIGIRLLFTGPLEQRDLNGLDVHYNIANYLYKDLENRISPSPLLKSKVEKGELGIKSGKGFYDWKDMNESEVMKRKNIELLKVIKYLHSIEQHDK